MKQNGTHHDNRPYNAQNHSKSFHNRYDNFDEAADWAGQKGKGKKRGRKNSLEDRATSKGGYRAQNNNYGNRSKRYDKSALLQNSKTPKKLFFVDHESTEIQAQKEKAIESLKAQKLICPRCGEVIEDIASSIEDRATRAPIHFECAMSELSKEERLGEGEKLCYIGQGRFAVLYYENPRDPKTFKIKKILPWEKTTEGRTDWRDKLSALYSQIE